MLNKLSYVFVALVAVFVLCQLILPRNKTTAIRRSQRQAVEAPAPRAGFGRGRTSSPSSDLQSGLRVVEISVCRDVQNLRPAGVGTRFPPDVRSLFCFTLTQGASGPQVIYHEWQHEGKVEASIPLSVEDERWRTWSRKAIRPDQVGTWKVLVRDSDGRVLGETSFEIVPRRR